MTGTVIKFETGDMVGYGKVVSTTEDYVKVACFYTLEGRDDIIIDIPRGYLTHTYDPSAIMHDD